MTRCSPRTKLRTLILRIRTNVVVLALGQERQILKPNLDHCAVLAVWDTVRSGGHFVVSGDSNAARIWRFAGGRKCYPLRFFHFAVLIGGKRDAGIGICQILSVEFSFRTFVNMNVAPSAVLRFDLEIDPRPFDRSSVAGNSHPNLRITVGSYDGITRHHIYVFAS